LGSFSFGLILFVSFLGGTGSGLVSFYYYFAEKERHTQQTRLLARPIARGTFLLFCFLEDTRLV
jgi:hypothetical protein